MHVCGLNVARTNVARSLYVPTVWKSRHNGRLVCFLYFHLDCLPDDLAFVSFDWLFQIVFGHGVICFWSAHFPIINDPFCRFASVVRVGAHLSISMGTTAHRVPIRSCWCFLICRVTGVAIIVSYCLFFFFLFGWLVRLCWFSCFVLSTLVRLDRLRRFYLFSHKS